MKYLITFTFLVILVFELVECESDYCTIQSCQPQTHTMCKYQGLGSDCHGYQEYKIFQSDREIILNAHNDLRRNVADGKETRGAPGPQPRARYMPNLNWDNELERIAQRWADQCTFGHDSCRNVVRYSVGQNAALQSFYGTLTKEKAQPLIVQMINNWYNEVKDFNKNYVSGYPKNYKGPTIGHYTQVVWAKTEKVGCGVIAYNTTGDSYNKLTLICNYGPAGNYEEQPVYEIAQ